MVDNSQYVINNVLEFANGLKLTRQLLADTSKEAQTVDRVYNQLINTVRKYISTVAIERNNAKQAQIGGPITPVSVSSRTLLNQVQRFEQAVTSGSSTRVSTDIGLGRTTELINALGVAAANATAKLAAIPMPGPVNNVLGLRRTPYRGTTPYTSASAGFTADSRPFEDPAVNEFLSGDAEEQARLLNDAEKRRKDRIFVQEQQALANAAQLRAQLEDSKTLPGGKEKVDEILARAKEKNFKPSDLYKVREHAETGVTDIKFRQKDSSGYYRDLDFTVDKYGKTLLNTNRRLQDFTTGLSRNIMEFTKWSIAVALVLGPLQKIGELAQATVEQQDKLVNVTIALGESQKSMNQIYTEAYKVAQSVSEEVGNVIDAYTLAYRATGGSTNETERFTVATNLLSQSMILSKLAGMDEATAIDTLTASLKQTNQPLTEGAKLLDMWVKATQIANVDLESLATSFAVVGDAAGNAGLSSEELTGLIATLGETGIASGRELANMGKAMVSGFQSDSARKTLESYGIAVTDVTGKARSFMSIMEDLSAIKPMKDDKGVLNTGQYSDITLALGGGTRRQSVWSTFIENLDRVREVANGVADATGTAMEAAAKKYETVSSASTRLGNSLSNLAMTLGTKGGLLDAFKDVLSVLNGLSIAFEKISGLAGRMGPTLIGLGALVAMGKVKGPSWVTNMENKALGATNAVFSPFTKLFSRGQYTLDERNNRVSVGDRNAAEGATNFLLPRGYLGGNSWGQIAGGAALTGLAMFGTATDSSLNKYQKSDKLWAQAGGAIAGAAITALTGGNALIGMAIGSAISDAFITATVANDTDFSEFFEKVIYKDMSDAEKKKTEQEKTPKERQDDLYRQAQKEYGGGSAWLGGIYSWRDAAQSKFMSSLPKWLSGNIGEATNGRQLEENLKQRKLLYLTASPELKKMLDDLNYELNPTEFYESQTTAQKAYQDKYATDIANIQSSYKDKAMKELTSGVITSSEYKKQIDNINKLNVTIPMALSKISPSYSKLTGKTEKEMISDFADVYSYSNEEQVQSLTSLLTAISDDEKALNKAKVGTEEYSKAQQQLNIDIANASSAMATFTASAVYAQAHLVGIRSDTGVSMSDFMNVVVPMAQNRTKQMAIQGGLPPEKIDEYVANIPPINSETANGFTGNLKGMDSASIDWAIQQAQDSGKISKQSAFGSLGWKTFDATSAQYAQAEQQYNTIVSQLKAKGASINEEELVVKKSDSDWSRESKDWKIMEYLLAQILDTEQKQLQTSLYNFPAGMDAVVSFGSAMAGINKSNSAGVSSGGTPFAAALGSDSLPDYNPHSSNAVEWGPSSNINKNNKPNDTYNNSLLEFKKQDYLSSRTSLGGIGKESILKDLFGGSSFGNFNNMFKKEVPNLFNDNTSKTAGQKVTVDIKSTVNLTVDGRILASVLSRYQGDRVARSTNAGSSVVRLNYL